MIPPTEGCPDLNELQTEQLAHQVHGDLAWSSECFGPRLGPKSLCRDSPLFGNGLLNGIGVETNDGCGRRFTGAELIPQRLPRYIHRYLAVLQRRVGEKLDDRALELTNIRTHMFGDESNDILWN